MRTVRSKVAREIFEDAKLRPFDLTDQDGNTVQNYLNACKDVCHEAAAANGWWHNRSSVNPTIYDLQDRNVGEAIALMHSELSEGFEAARKDLPSDKIEGFSGLEEELADTLIRIFDFAGGANLRLGEAFVAKLKYNTTREDHKLEAREAAGGKKM